MIEKDQVWGSDSVDQTLLSPDGSKILTRSSSSIQIWDAESCQLISIWEVQNSAAIFSPDGEKILVSESHSKGFSWNLRNVTTGKLLRSGRTENRAKFLSFSPDGKEFIEIDDGVISNNMRIRSIEEKGEASLTVTFSRLHELDFFYGLNTAYYSPSGRSVITADRNGWVRLLNPKKGFWSWHSYIKPPSRMYPFTSASLSPDATQVLLTGEYGRVLDRISGKILYEFKHPGWLSRITSASFSPDGNRLISSSNDNTARIWNAETRAHLHTLEGHTDTVHSASFFPDSHRIVTGSKDQPVIVWDPKIRNILEM
jgi:WD40 repeat protein